MKKFAFSWSRFKNYRTCPKRYYEIDVTKNVKEEPGEALLWGNQVHEALAQRINGGLKLPITMQQYDDWPQRILSLKEDGVQVLVENRLAMDEHFRPTAFFDQSTWFRSVVDVMMILPKALRAAITIDWKTGKIDPEFEQLAMSASAVFAHNPDVDIVGAIYVWLGNDSVTTKVYERDKMVPIWNDLYPGIRQMEEAHRTLTFPPKPSGLCKRHCPVVSCPHHGKGSY